MSISNSISSLYPNSVPRNVYSPSLLSKHVLNSLPIIEPTLNPSIASSAISISHIILTTYCCFFNSTLDSSSLILIIMFMIMKLCYFPGYNPIPVTYLSIYLPTYISHLLSLLTIAIIYIEVCPPTLSGHPRCTNDKLFSPETYVTYLFIS